VDGVAADAKPAPKAYEKPRFTFYEELARPNTVAPAAPEVKTPLKPASPAETGSSLGGAPPPDRSAKAVGADARDFIYFLQAGAFQTQEDADNQKAKIALSGYEARVRVAETPDKGRVHRVRMGPYPTLEEATDVLENLKEGGISATVIKVNKNPPKLVPAPPLPPAAATTPTAATN
jgi:cell division protein FtsN